jgi:hypothetical protein
VFLQTTVPTRKTGNSGKVPIAQPKKDPPKMDKAAQVREVSYETSGKTWNRRGRAHRSSSGCTQANSTVCRSVVRIVFAPVSIVAFYTIGSASQVNISASRT